MQMEKKKTGVAVLIADKIDFKTKVTVKDKEGLYIMIKKTNPTRGYNPYKHLCTQHRST